MTEHGVAPSRQVPTRVTDRGRQGRPAHTAKIVTAGLASTAVLGLTAIIGWQANRVGADTTVPIQPVEAVAIDPALQAAIERAVRSAVVDLTVPPTSVAGVPAATVPPSPSVAPAPASVAVAVPVPIPTARPAAQPTSKTQSARPSNGTTKSSG